MSHNVSPGAEIQAIRSNDLCKCYVICDPCAKWCTRNFQEVGRGMLVLYMSGEDRSTGDIKHSNQLSKDHKQQSLFRGFEKLLFETVACLRCVDVPFLSQNYRMGAVGRDL